MKLFIFLITISIIACWAVLIYFLLGHTTVDGISLKLPETTAAFSDSTSFLNGLFSSFAVVLALVAVLLQGHELKASTAAQNEQAVALKEQLWYQQKITNAQLERSESLANQLKTQQTANKIMLLQAKQQYHVSEMDRMDSIIENIRNTNRDDNLFQNCVDKKGRHRYQLDEIQEILDALV